MTLYKNIRSLAEISTLTFSLIIFILSSSYTYDENLYFECCSEQIRNCCLSETISEDLLNSETPAKMFVPWSFTENSSAKNLNNALTWQFNKTNNVSTELNFAYPYFPLVYTGYGVDHMNINLVNLTLTGLIVGDEIGAGVTLVSEILPKEKRGYGVMIIASFGVLGVVAANLITEIFAWRNAYIIGGILGFMLLLLRFRVKESAMFQHNANRDIKKGDFISLFSDKKLFAKYIKAILIGMPIWYVVGVLVMFSPEFAKALEISEKITAGQALMYCYIGLSVGDLASGYLSQQMQSRKQAYNVFMILSIVSIGYYFTLFGANAFSFYLAVFFLGVFCGYWALFITMAAEQFGTNIRATVATTVPNVVRGSVIPITSSFILLKDSFGVLGSASIVGCIVFSIAFWALYTTKETFHKDLDYIEV
jgi:MFS family permease